MLRKDLAVESSKLSAALLLPLQNHCKENIVTNKSGPSASSFVILGFIEGKRSEREVLVDHRGPNSRFQNW